MADDLEAFVDEGIRRARERGYHPTAFVQMRERYLTVEAIRRLVRSGDIQSGFKRMKELGMLEWTLEQAVIQFPQHFNNQDIAAAEWRLAQAAAAP